MIWLFPIEFEIRTILMLAGKPTPSVIADRSKHRSGRGFRMFKSGQIEQAPASRKVSGSKNCIMSTCRRKLRKVNQPDSRMLQISKTVQRNSNAVQCTAVDRLMAVYDIHKAEVAEAVG